MTGELKIGDQIKDNDPRMGNRVLTVVDMDTTHTRVFAENSMGRECRIQRSRIFTDGKPRKTGFSKLD